MKERKATSEWGHGRGRPAGRQTTDRETERTGKNKREGEVRERAVTGGHFHRVHTFAQLVVERHLETVDDVTASAAEAGRCLGSRGS